MANIQNRSPWFVKIPKGESVKFRSRKQAEAYLADLENPKASISQGDTAWEAQIRLIDVDLRLKVTRDLHRILTHP